VGDRGDWKGSKGHREKGERGEQGKGKTHEVINEEDALFCLLAMQFEATFAKAGRRSQHIVGGPRKGREAGLVEKRGARKPRGGRLLSRAYINSKGERVLPLSC